LRFLKEIIGQQTDSDGNRQIEMIENRAKLVRPLMHGSFHDRLFIKYQKPRDPVNQSEHEMILKGRKNDSTDDKK